MKEFRTRADFPALVLRAFTALNKACSQAAAFTGVGAGGFGVGGGVGVGVGEDTEIVTVLIVLPAALVAVMV